MRLRWPRFQFSLRTFLIVTALLAAVIGVHVRRGQYYAARTEAAKKIEKLGWRLTVNYPSNIDLIGPIYDAENKPRYEDLNRIPLSKLTWLQTWDRYWYGIESLLQYNELSIGALPRFKSDVSENELPDLLKHFPEIQALAISNQGYGGFGGPPTDLLYKIELQADHLRALTCWANLRSIDGEFTKLNDDCVAAIPTDNQLEYINTTHGQLTTNGYLQLLARCPKLRRIEVPVNQLTDELIAVLNQRSSLRPNIVLTDSAIQNLEITLTQLRKIKQQFEITQADIPFPIPEDVHLKWIPNHTMTISQLPMLVNISLTQYDWEITNCTQLEEVTATIEGSLKLCHLPVLQHLQLGFGKLAHLHLEDCPKITKIPTANRIWLETDDSFELVEALTIKDCNGLERLSSNMTVSHISGCPNMTFFSTQNWLGCQNLLPQLADLRALELSRLDPLLECREILGFLSQIKLLQLKALHLPGKLCFADSSCKLLKQFNNLRLLVIEDYSLEDAFVIESDDSAIAMTISNFLEHLPPQLEYLIIKQDSPENESILRKQAEQFPKLKLLFRPKVFYGGGRNNLKELPDETINSIQQEILDSPQ